ncbi:Rop family plasmid primer RNA-binding protein, partial [Escherichia coli]
MNKQQQTALNMARFI